MREISYHESVEMERNERLRRMEKQLPLVCTDFFRSISHTTSALTRLAYAYDYRLFFDYLKKESYLFAEADIPMLGDQELKQIGRRDIEGYQDYLSHYYKNSADGEPGRACANHELGIMRKLCSLRSLFEYLYKSGHIDANVTTLVSLPKVHEKPILRLEEDELTKFLHTVETGDGLTDRQQKLHERTQVRDRAIMLLFLGTGIRVSECVGLNLQDLDFELNAFLVTRKGGNQTILYFSEQVAQALSEYLDERNQIEPLEGHEDALFLSSQKRRITQRAVENLVKKYALVAAPLKKRMSPHKLRSTFGTNLYLETGDIYLVADVLGHSNVNTTRKHYAAMTDLRKREAVKYVNLPSEQPADLPEKDSRQLTGETQESHAPRHARHEPQTEDRHDQV